MQTPTLLDTIKLANEAHSKTNATDKGGKTPYYWHLVRVMLRLQTEDVELMQIAVLHDVVEDTGITIEDLRNLGYSERVLESVKWCSKNMFPELTFNQWMTLIGHSAPEDAILLKIADISDNTSFERMTGLMRKGTPKHSHKNVNELLVDRVNKMVTQKMRLSGEMGVYTRYYNGWNLLFKNENNLKLIDKIYTGDFCKISQLLSLTQYIPQNEMLDYLRLNKIHTWSIPGELKIFNDNAGQEYLGLKFKNDDLLHYSDFLNTKIDSSFTNKQKVRDKDQYHLTVLNTGEYGFIKKRHPEKLALIEGYLNKEYDIFTYGIGSVQGNVKETPSQTWYVVADNGYMQTLRGQLGFKPSDFHITLAFEYKDLHKVSKNKSTIIYSNKELWESFCYSQYPQIKKPKLG